MKSIHRRLGQLARADLHALSEAIALELQRRREIAADVPDWACSQTVQREQGDRRNELPLRAVGVGGAPPLRRAA